jgi:hypothetical protein
MPTKSNAQGEDLVRRQRLDRFAVDAARARNEYAEMQEAVDERTARLRRQRLKREAAEAGAPKTKRKAPTKTGGRAEEQDHPARSTAEPHRFQPGQKVRITSGLSGRASSSGPYKILDRLPADQSGSNFYRIRSDGEQHDRVVAETQLSRVKR